MTSFKAGETDGLIAFFKEDHAFRFVQTNEGDIFIPPALVRERQKALVQDARVKLSYRTDSKSRLVATEILSVEAPANEKVHRGTIKFYLPKKFYGFIEGCEDFPETDIFFHGSVSESAGFLYEEGMPVEFGVMQEGDKPKAAFVRLVRASTSRKKGIKVPPPASGPKTLILSAN